MTIAEYCIWYGGVMYCTMFRTTLKGGSGAMSFQGIIERYRNYYPIPVVISDSSSINFPFTYYTLDLCGDRPNTRSDYIIDEKDGRFRENNCGIKNSGHLAFSELAIVEFVIFGKVSGWIYNATNAKLDRSYFFSDGQPFPDDLPGAYLLVKGKPHQPGGVFEFDPGDVAIANRG